MRPFPLFWKVFVALLFLFDLDVENGNIEHTYRGDHYASNPGTLNKDFSRQLELPIKDDISFSQSFNSRKDSGIKSNSRRSSIQNQLFINGVSPCELLAHRVSGYYTSSQSSINNDSEKGQSNGSKLLPSAQPLCVYFQNLRKQSDLQLIRCVQDNSKSERSYFVTPPLKRWSLLFKQPEMEKEYREKAHRTSPTGTHKVCTLATARFNTYFDVIVSLVVFSLVSFSCFIIFPSSIPWMTVFTVFALIQAFILFLCIRSMKKPTIIPRLEPLLQWYPWHVIGTVLVSLPLIGVLVNFNQATTSRDNICSYSYLVFVGIVHYCNFTQLNCWLKSSLATVGACIYLGLITSALINHPELMNDSFNSSLVHQNVSSYSNTSFEEKHSPYFVPEITGGFDQPNLVSDTSDLLRLKRRTFEIFQDVDPTKRHSTEDPFHITPTDSFRLKRDGPVTEDPLQEGDERLNATDHLSRSDAYLVEIYLDIFLLILLVWFLNREFEISYRLSFHGNSVAAKDKARVEAMKNQADLLLDNIIPKHVAKALKDYLYYSKDVRNAGIIFASVINFDAMYDESYLGGKECLRVLNELISDFDELLYQGQFTMVEKIKTIGATFMAASGLDVSDQDNHEHIFQLMEFALKLQEVMRNFNAHLLEVTLSLRIGFNIGDVSAGVIGNTKWHYDIWGDAVNVASRMDSNGTVGRIQVPSTCVGILSERYVLEHKGSVNIKGKDYMDVYLVVGRKSDGENTHSPS